jgi:D-xylulose reductase
MSPSATTAEIVSAFTHFTSNHILTKQNPAFVLHSIKNISIENRAVPKLRSDHDVRVHIEKTGICGSDVHYWQRGRIGDFILKSPIVLGHESSGTIVEVGKAVKNVKVGDRGSFPMLLMMKLKADG